MSMAKEACGLQKANNEANTHVLQASKGNVNIQSLLQREIKLGRREPIVRRPFNMDQQYGFYVSKNLDLL